MLGLPYGTVDRIAKAIPDGVKVGFDESLQPGQELREMYDDPTPIGRSDSGREITAKELIDMARPLEGLVRQDSIHAAAVVIGDRPLALQCFPTLEENRSCNTLGVPCWYWQARSR